MSCVTSNDRDLKLITHRGDEVLQISPCLRVYRGKRLVHQQQLRLVGNGARDRHTLLHAARKLPRITVTGAREPNRLETLLLPDFVARRQ